jgi:hypothetical protein
VLFNGYETKEHESIRDTDTSGRHAYQLLQESLKERDHLEELGVDGIFKT